MKGGLQILYVRTAICENKTTQKFNSISYYSSTLLKWPAVPHENSKLYSVQKFSLANSIYKHFYNLHSGYSRSNSQL